MLKNHFKKDNRELIIPEILFARTVIIIIKYVNFKGKLYFNSFDHEFLLLPHLFSFVESLHQAHLVQNVNRNSEYGGHESNSN